MRACIEKENGTYKRGSLLMCVCRYEYFYKCVQLILNGYEIISKASTQLAKVCSESQDTTWLSTSRHSIEGYFDQASAASTPFLNISYSGLDTGDKEVILLLYLFFKCL